MIIVADTGPLNYLLLLECVDLLPRLYGDVLIPEAVVAELSDERSPPVVKRWLTNLPAWLKIRKVIVPIDELNELGAGEREAITLAQETKADLLLLDDWDARQAAHHRKLIVAGTLRVLEDAAIANLIDLTTTIAKLRITNFRISDKLIEAMIDRDRQRRNR